MHPQSTQPQLARQHLSPILCAFCGVEFRPANRSVRFCTPACGYQSRSAIAPRFWAKVDRVTTPDGCWLWLASCYPDGYGQFKVSNKNHRASRISYELAHGPIPDGLLVCHNCPDGDNLLCVNPAHLWLGTVKQNAQDMVAKGRAPDGSWLRPLCGEENPRAKLTASQVATIREVFAAGGVTFAALARTYGVTNTLIIKIVRGELWK